MPFTQLDHTISDLLDNEEERANEYRAKYPLTEYYWVSSATYYDYKLLRELPVVVSDTLPDSEALKAIALTIPADERDRTEVIMLKILGPEHPDGFEVRFLVEDWAEDGVPIGRLDPVTLVEELLNLIAQG